MLLIFYDMSKSKFYQPNFSLVPLVQTQQRMIKEIICKFGKIKNVFFASPLESNF